VPGVPGSALQKDREIDVSLWEGGPWDTMVRHERLG
jgi:hypothetical protein